MSEIMVKEKKEFGVTDWDETKILPISENDWQLIKRQKLLIYLAITNRCNMSCKVCYLANEDGSFPFDEMSLEDIRRFLKKVGKNKKIHLFGGEPTVREDIFEIIQMIKKSGNIPMLFTNGIRLAEFSYVERLAKAGIRRICLSLDGLNESTTTALRGSGEYLKLKLKAIENLRMIKAIKVWLTPLIYQGNKWEIPNLIKFAISNKEVVKGIVFIAYRPWGRCENFPREQVYIQDLISCLDEVTGGQLNNEYFSEFDRLRKKLNRLLGKYGISLSINYLSVPSKIDRQNLKQFIPIERLREINDCLEKDKHFSLLKYAYRYTDWLRLFRDRLFNPTSIAFEIYARNVLNVVIATLVNPSEIMREIYAQEGEKIGIGMVDGMFFVCIAKG